jgi:peptidase M28-like protein
VLLLAHRPVTLTLVSRRVKALCSGLALVFAVGCGGAPKDSIGDPTPQAATLRPAARAFDGERAFEDVRSQVEIGAREAGTAGGRLEVALIRGRLRAAGRRHIRVQRGWQNVVVTIPGGKPGTVVVGAHHDTKDGIPGFVGANDGGSGVGVLLEMARVLPRRMPGPALTLVFFDAEEARGDLPFTSDGTRGSRQFARYANRAKRRQGSPMLETIKAMFLLDMVGDCDLKVPREAYSNPGLYRRLRGAAFGGTTGGILDDHIRFKLAGVPVVDVIDFTYGPPGSPGGGWWHTPNDTLDKVCAASLGQVGKAVIRAVGTL